MCLRLLVFVRVCCGLAAAALMLSVGSSLQAAAWGNPALSRQACMHLWSISCSWSHLTSPHPTIPRTQAAAAAAAGVSSAPVPVKSVVFSQFVGMLDLVEGALAAEGIPNMRLDGKTSAANRRAAIRAFAGEAAMRVFGGGRSQVCLDQSNGVVVSLQTQKLRLLAHTHTHIPPALRPSSSPTHPSPHRQRP